MLERAKPSNILAQKKHFSNEKRAEINLQDSVQKEEQQSRQEVTFLQILMSLINRFCWYLITLREVQNFFDYYQPLSKSSRFYVTLFKVH